MELKGKTVMVLGLARTGLETARFLSSHGASVIVSDCRSEPELSEEVKALSGLPVRFFLGGEDESWLEGVDGVVASPGVPESNPLLRGAKRRRLGIFSEIELAYRFLKVPLVAITGTNGKSTTTTLIGEMLKAAGRNVFVGGNIGSPLIRFVAQQAEWGVVEVSSFQLEWVETFRPRVAVLLNVTEDHLDRYPSFGAYCRAKEKIFAAQTEQDVAVLNRDDPVVWAMKDRIRARIVSVGLTEVEEGLFATGSEIIWRQGMSEERFSLSQAKIQGVHNLENMMAAIAVAKSLGIERAAIQRTLEEFPGLDHRLEFVREINGIRFYDDSKGTNVGAVVKSLASFAAPVILLAGGVDKGGDYLILEGEIKRKVKRLILFGAAKKVIARALGHLTDTVVVDNLAAAVGEAFANAERGDVVLLSPACSSFDMFRNYAERGEAFKALVRQL